MAEAKISTVVTSINQASGLIRVDDNYLILNAQVSKTGKINVRCAGTFGTAVIRVGYIDNGVFSVEEQENGSPADFTETFSLQFTCGKHTNPATGPAIQVATIDGDTNLSLTISSVD